MAQGRRTSFITAVKRDGLEAEKRPSFITAVETDDYEGRGEQGIRKRGRSSPPSDPQADCCHVARLEVLRHPHGLLDR